MANAYEEAIETCRELGTKAAKARHYQDEATCRFHTDYMRRFVDARPDFKADLRKAFDDAYRTEAGIYMSAALSKARLDGKL